MEHKKYTLHTKMDKIHLELQAAYDKTTKHKLFKKTKINKDFKETASILTKTYAK